MPFSFDGYVFDERLVELRRDGQAVAVEPQVFDVIHYLLRNRDRVVPKVELLESVWGDQFVSESALTTCIKQARQALGDNGRDQRVIKTAHGKGYRFVAAVETETHGLSEERPPNDSGARSTGHGSSAPPLPPPAPVHGREGDVASIRKRLEARRLVSLVGMGGIGKTYLLHQLDRELAGSYSDGSIVVELAPVRSEDAVGSALLEAVRGADKTTADPADAFLDWLETRNVLLLIDNAEHVVGQVAELCSRVLARCNAVDVIVTSRTRLEIPGESVHLVGPLDIEPAVALFVERAFDGGADLDPEHPGLHQLCQKLDGVPLALEIMAARAPLLSIPDLTADLQRHLAASNPVGDERHRTLEATLRWSLDDLAERELHLLEDLTVFAGSFDLTAAEAVARVEDVTEPLLDLCRRSLVLPGPNAETSRFRLLEPVRLFAAATTNQDGTVVGQARARHAGYYRHLVARADRQIASHDVDQGMSLMWTEWPNIRAAYNTYLADRDVEAMTALVNTTANYSEARLLAEVYEWADRTYEIALEDSVPVDVVLKANVARFASHSGQLDKLTELLADVDPDHPSNHVRMGFIVRDWYQGRPEAVHSVLDTAIEEVAGDGGYWEATLSVLRLMSTPASGSRPTHLLDRLESLDATDGISGSLFAQVGRGVRSAWDGQQELAAAELDRAVAKAEALGAAGFAQLVHSLRSRTHRAIGEPSGAAAALAEWIERALDSGGWSMAADSLGSAASLLVDGGRADLAARILAARRAAGYRFSQQYERMLQDRIEAALDAESRAENEAQGAQLNLAGAIEAALNELRVLAKTA